MQVVRLARKVIVLTFGFILGTILGSGVKALADRSLQNRSFWGRSYCPNCKNKLQWYDLLPVLSYLILRGKCRYCHKKIGISYLLVEVGMGILIGFLFWQSFSNFQFPARIATQSVAGGSIFLFEIVSKTFFLTVLAILFLTDLKKMLIPDRIVLPAIWIGLISLLAVTLYKIGYLYYYLSQSPVGRLLLPPHSEYFKRHAIAAAEPLFYGILTGLLIGGFFLSLIIVTRGKGMGGGDVKLGAFIGVMLGFPQALFALVLAFLTGAIFSVGLILAGKKHFGQTLPFGPFLVLGSLVMLFWGENIVKWYLHIGR